MERAAWKTRRAGGATRLEKLIILVQILDFEQFTQAVDENIIQYRVEVQASSLGHNFKGDLVAEGLLVGAAGCQSIEHVGHSANAPEEWIISLTLSQSALSGSAAKFRTFCFSASVPLFKI